MLDFESAVIVELPAIIKAHTDAGKRIVEVESSTESVDAEGDCIRQSALMDSAASFIKSGHLDMEHFSEIGHRIGIRDPNSFIVGRPIEVKDIGMGRTSVVGEIFRAPDGIHDPVRNRYDALWDTLQPAVKGGDTPLVEWRASIFGFPVGEEVLNCRTETCPSGATRFEIKAMSWRSLAFTRTPVNDSLTGFARIITAKSLIARFAKSFPEGNMGPGTFAAMGMSENVSPPTQPPSLSPAPGSLIAPPRTLAEALGQYHHHMRRDCTETAGMKSLAGFKQHFTVCCGMSPEDAELFSHATLYHLLLDKRRS